MLGYWRKQLELSEGFIRLYIVYVVFFVALTIVKVRM